MQHHARFDAFIDGQATTDAPSGVGSGAGAGDGGDGGSS